MVPIFTPRWKEVDGKTNFGIYLNALFEVNALYVACTHANFEAVKTLIDCRGAELDTLDVLWQRDSRGSLPLHWVTQSDLPKESFGYSNAGVRDKAQSIANIVELLFGLDPTIINVTDNDGNTPLHYATRSPSRYDKMYTPIIQLLCARGGDASIQNTEGQTPLHTLFRLEDGGDYRDYFCEKNSVDIATVTALLAQRASPADMDKAVDTPLQRQTWNGPMSYHFFLCTALTLPY
ncbi:hypothetical protein AU210_012646 [Fusarium oxysporum f. sp. radicis-cucumerinum]|uniref:Uncharacterized protein n=2 Tax=Fusarium oxysporum TaxID=5507 RepID=A0A2H3GHR6_FUSOX|nr:hypothetical protein FOZG_16704 [Fusarium oxysporum Fo47]PCD26214.1 hypothetical protein AU210_012646 [Fusarium oxysporum f. sp. radicis-cucumerinum]RKL04290.1 hypothetical protein BFJ71_g3671 [Fusarium oxysporum]